MNYGEQRVIMANNVCLLIIGYPVSHWILIMKKTTRSRNYKLPRMAFMWVTSGYEVTTRDSNNHRWVPLTVQSTDSSN